MPIGGFFKKLFFRKTPDGPADAQVDALRIEFRDRYHSFKLLLSANNKALEIMAGIEEALHGSRPFGMAFVRAACTSVSVNVFSMIRNIERLAPEKYAGLFTSFDGIQRGIDEILTRRKVIEDERLVIPLSHVTKDLADVVGGKMANLGEIKNSLNLRVPPGFGITVRAYQRFVEHNDLQAEIDRRMQAAESENIEALYSLSAEIQQLIIRAEVPPDLVDAVHGAWSAIEREAGGPVTVALRSSAIGEDAAGSSFAGQYRSELNVSAENVFAAYKDVLASKYSLAAISYRLNKGFRDEDVAMCVGGLVMVNAMAGGVTYTRNPVDIHDHGVFINSSWGLPKAVVDGSDACDLFVVSRQEPMALTREDVHVKERKFVCYPEEGVCRLDLTGEDKALPSLTAAQAVELARLAVTIEAHYGVPQDIEWAIDPQGTIFLLQCRPLQQKQAAEAEPPPDAHSPAPDSILCRGGITASPGAACGPVFIAEKAADVLAFPEKGVLVIRQAQPRWASLLNRAAAVVSEQGGFAGHLANVAREFGVPALFGVADAARRMPAGQIVTVDASGRAVHRGRVEELLVETPARQALMQGSPVHDILSEAGRLIVPLNLLDPDAPEFAPAGCRTLHDITRFIHEKSVSEMFDFGKDHGFSERSSKQLHYHVPMQWWILNLDDGFNEEIPGKYVNARADRLGSDARLLERVRRHPLGGAAGDGRQGHAVRHVPGDHQPGPDRREAVQVRRAQLFHDLPALLQPEPAAGVSLRDHGSPGERTHAGKLRELPVQGRRHGLRAAARPGALHRRNPGADRVSGGDQGGSPPRPRRGPERGVHAQAGGASGLPRPAHPSTRHGHDQPRACELLSRKIPQGHRAAGRDDIALHLP